MPRKPDRDDDYYRQQVTDGQVDHVAHGDCGMKTAAETDESAEVRFRMSERPPQNEQGNQRVARQLADALTKRDGAQWTAETDAPTGPERGVDWNLIDPRGTVRRFRSLGLAQLSDGRWPEEAV